MTLATSANVRCTCSVFDAANRPDTRALADLVARAWGHDYADKAVIRFDAPYLDWLLQGDRWFGVQVTDGEGRLVGCEVALEREICWEGRSLRGYFVTLLTVDPDHRGRGLAQRILGQLTEEALGRRGGDVLVSCFDAGAAGQPTVEKMVAGAKGAMGLRLSPALSLWACTADLREADRYEPLKGLARVALWPGVRSLLAFSPDRGPAPEAKPARLEDAAAEMPSGTGFAFRPGEGLGEMYAAHDDGRAGTLRFEFGEREAVTVAWHVSVLAKPGLPDRLMGSVQFVRSENASARNLARALRHVNGLLLKQGCLGTTILDTSVVPRRVLWRAGFRPTPRRIRVAVRGPAATLEPFPALRGPFSVDLL
jgi:GNAT superfamily N-acetyltransferase